MQNIANKLDQGGTEQQIRRFKKGQYIFREHEVGEMALIDNHPRMASARCVNATEVVVVSRKMFEKHMDGATPFVRALLGILAANTRSMSDQLVAAASQPAAGSTNRLNHFAAAATLWIMRCEHV